MTIEEIRELVHLVLSTGVAEIEVQRGENKVWIKRASQALTQEVTLAPAVVAGVASTHAAAVAPSPASASEDTDLTDPTLVPVKSPIVGTFYESSAPGAASFVKIGDTVETST
ncbi:MAG: acetyl-CoA carboxylase, biotin carboxyl carrier protein, partial [Bryobacterales bacterium]|nr:acetyl-CoA carboxylase, biotin carboxyl carrier protein [Bryobacterales bacterium]